MKLEKLKTQLEKQQKKEADLTEKLATVQADIQQLNKKIEAEELYLLKKTITEKGLTLTEALESIEILHSSVPEEKAVIETNDQQSMEYN